MSTDNISISREWIKIIFHSSSNTHLICSSEFITEISPY